MEDEREEERALPRAEPRSFGPLHPEGKHRGRLGPYILERRLCNAANTAWVLGRPLLLTGEPGCGKTDFAWVVAHARRFSPVLDEGERAEAEAKGEWAPLQCHVRTEMAARDLLYHYDALLRFVDTHHKGEGVDPTDLSRYFELRGLGKALAWPEGRPADERPVLLIDEIDKAPRDLPNDLLQALDVGQFEIAELREDERPIALRSGFTLRRTMGKGQPATRRPFVVITSNVEQQLPEPFLRRCVFFHIEFPKKARLREIVRRRPAHDEHGKELALSEPLVEAAVDVFLALRNEPELSKKPATSELLDWTEALLRCWEPGSVARWLEAFAGQVEGRRQEPDDKLVLAKTKQVRWRNLPGLECLLKLRGDLEQVQALEQ
jgi:MoxR-like ATPase